MARVSRWRRVLPAGVTAGLAVGGLVVPVSAQSQTQLLADGSAVAFSLRPAYDMGGAEPLNLYVGYADANVATPEPEADGQASWYNLSILETGLFLPPEECTPEKNLAATSAGAQDLGLWLSDYLQRAVGALPQGSVPSAPTVPGFRHACTERFPGFTQSRFPATSTMPAEGHDNYVDKLTAAQVCRQDPASAQCGLYGQLWPALHGAARAVLQDGSFSAASTGGPSQSSQALLLGAGDGLVVSVGTARSTSSASLTGDTLVVESAAVLDGVCLGAVDGVCALRIDHLRQFARIVKRAGKPAVSSAGTVVTGVHGTGLARDVDAAALGLGDVDVGGSLHLAAVSSSGSCSSGRADPSVVLADAGGLLLTARSGPGGQGGGIMLGGACARARVERTTFELPGPSAGGVELSASPGASVPAGVSLGVGAPVAGSSMVGGPGPVTVGAPRLVRRSVTRYVFLRPLAWRTARYWVPVLGVLLLLVLACRVAPRHRAVAPVVGALDLFARRFLRG